MFVKTTDQQHRCYIYKQTSWIAAKQHRWVNDVNQRNDCKFQKSYQGEIDKYGASDIALEIETAFFVDE